VRHIRFDPADGSDTDQSRSTATGRGMVDRPLSAYLMNILFNWRIWLAVGMLIVGMLVWFQFGGWLWGLVYKPQKVVDEGRKVVEEIDKLQVEREAAQTALREMSKRIQTLTSEANKLRAKADQEAADRRRLEQTAGELRVRIAELEQQRRTQPKVTTTREAFDALRALGF